VVRFYRFAFWLAASFAFVMAVLPHPIEVPTSDKVQHMAAFLVITLFGCAGYRGLPRVKLMLALFAFGGIIELIQLIPELHRDSEWGDWLADIVAVLVALAVAHFVERQRAERAD
jgi:hypothetical protein